MNQKVGNFFARSELTRSLVKFRREFWIVGFFSLVVNLLMLSPTLYMLQVYDRVMVSQSGFTLVALSLITVFFFLVIAIAEFVRSRLLVRAGVAFDEQLNNRVFNATFEAYLNQAKINPVQAFSDLTNIRQFMTGNGVFAFFDAPWAPIYIAVLFMLHPFLGIMSIVFALILATLAIVSNRLTYAPAEKVNEDMVQVNSYVHSKLRNADVIESMGMLQSLRHRWQERHQRALHSHSELQDLSHRIQDFSKFLRYSQQSLSLGAGALLVIYGELSPGAMIAANVLMQRALQPIDLMVGTWKSLISARTAFERLEKLLGEHPERPAGFVHDDPKGAISLQDLVASTPNRSQPILKNLNLAFPENAVVGIIGPSGSGKSTLARCLVGIWPDVQGKVLLDGEPIESWDRVELGPHIGYLPQDVEMFEGTIAENIARFGDVDPEKVIEAAKRSGVHDMILRFPKGYDTQMGEAGNLLSGGQKQRIGLARAMYGNPALVVLDEPNANLDDVGEAALIQAVADLKAQGKTVFLITHRMNILGVVDQLLVLHDGKAQAYGARDQVIAALQAPRTAATTTSEQSA